MSWCVVPWASSGGGGGRGLLQLYLGTTPMPHPIILHLHVHEGLGDTTTIQLTHTYIQGGQQQRRLAAIMA